jgi:hypothetical protein
LEIRTGLTPRVDPVEIQQCPARTWIFLGGGPGDFPVQGERSHVAKVYGRMFATVKRRWHAKLRGRPGHRFQDRYARAKQRRGGAGIRRIVNVVLAAVVFAVGIVFVFIPGPAVLFFAIAGALLAAESLTIARAMDALELQLRAGWRWFRRHRDSPAVETLLVGAILCGALVSAYACWRVWRG